MTSTADVAGVYRRLHGRVLRVWLEVGSPSDSEMAAHTGIPADRFPDLRSGDPLTWSSAEAVLLACGVDVHERQRWQLQLRVAALTARTAAGGRRTATPPGQRVAHHPVDRRLPAEAASAEVYRRGGTTTMTYSEDEILVDPLRLAVNAVLPAQFNQALNALRIKEGLSFQQLSTRTEGRLPRSTAHNMCAKETLPKRAEQVRQFVMGCGYTEQHAQRWVEQWQRLTDEGNRVRAYQQVARTTVGPAEVPAAGRADPAHDGAPPRHAAGGFPAQEQDSVPEQDAVPGQDAVPVADPAERTGADSPPTTGTWFSRWWKRLGLFLIALVVVVGGLVVAARAQGDPSVDFAFEAGADSLVRDLVLIGTATAAGRLVGLPQRTRR